MLWLDWGGISVFVFSFPDLALRFLCFYFLFLLSSSVSLFAFSLSSGPLVSHEAMHARAHARMYIYGCHDLSSTSPLLSFVPVARYHACTMRYYSRNRRYCPSSAFVDADVAADAAADAEASAHRQRACSRAPEISAQHGVSKVQREERRVETRGCGVIQARADAASKIVVVCVCTARACASCASCASYAVEGVQSGRDGGILGRQRRSKGAGRAGLTCRLPGRGARRECVSEWRGGSAAGGSASRTVVYPPRL